MVHTDPERDLCRPEYFPSGGQRVFVDSTPQIEEVLLRAAMNTLWEHPGFTFKKTYRNKMHAVRSLLKNLEGNFEAYIITI